MTKFAKFVLFAGMIALSWNELEEPKETFEVKHAIHHIDFKAN